MPGDVWQKLANVRSLLAFMYGHPGKKLLFMGTEIGQWNEWNVDHSLDWHLMQYELHQKLFRFLGDLNQVQRSHPAPWEQDFGWEGFEWIDFSDHDSSVISFIRWAKEHRECLVFVCSFTPVPRTGYRIGVPYHRRWRRLLDTDSADYWGSGHVSGQEIWSDAIPWHGKPASLNLTLPPLATTIFVPG